MTENGWLFLALYLGIGVAVSCWQWKQWAPREVSFYAWPRAKVYLFAAMFFALTVVGWPIDAVDALVGLWRRPKPVPGPREPGS